MINTEQIRSYQPDACAVFGKTSEQFGGLSNMAGGYPIIVNGVYIKTSEALYQACRFPFNEEAQQEIIVQNSPMTAKMKSKKYRPNTRTDWDSVNIRIMQWSLRAKLMQNYKSFSALLLQTKDLPIVEYSTKDRFWGAMPSDTGSLVGANILGRLLMQLRDHVKEFADNPPKQLPPLRLDNFLLFGKQIETVFYSAGQVKHVDVQGNLL